MRIPSLTPFASRSPLGWLPCVPAGYNIMDGELTAQCDSLSDQTPCSSVDSPLARGTYCPTVAWGDPGLGGLGIQPVIPEITGTIISGGGTDDTLPANITLQDMLNMNLPTLSPEVLTALQNASGGPRTSAALAPAATNWTPWIIGGAALTGILLIVVMSRR